MLRRFMFAGAIALVAIHINALARRPQRVTIHEVEAQYRAGVNMPPHFLFLDQRGRPIPIQVDESDRPSELFWRGRSFSQAHAQIWVARMLERGTITAEWAGILLEQIAASRVVPERQDPSGLKMAQEQFDAVHWGPFRGHSANRATVAVYYRGQILNTERGRMFASNREEARELATLLLNDAEISSPDWARLIGGTMDPTFFGMAPDVERPTIDIDEIVLTLSRRRASFSRSSRPAHTAG